MATHYVPKRNLSLRRAETRGGSGSEPACLVQYHTQDVFVAVC